MMVVACQHAQQERTVGNVAGNWTGNRQSEPSQVRGHVGNPAGGWAQSDYVAEVRRVAKRSAHVAAIGDGNHAGGKRYASTAGAASASLG